MAKLRSGILGPISGKINGHITSSWKNVNYIKKAAAPNLNPKSEAQLAQQEKFKFANVLNKALRPYVAIGFQHLAIDKTEMNLAFALNYKAVNGIYPDLSMDYSKVFISQGNLTPLQGLVMQQTGPQIIELKWDLNYDDNALLRFDDQLMLMVYCPVTGITDGFNGAYIRAAQKCSFRWGSRLKNHRLEIFVGVTAMNRKDAGNSIYLGSILPAEV